MISRRINLFEFSCYRKELMGLATLLIVLCHTTKYQLSMPSCIYVLLGNGGLGVDIFLFLSGMGIYNSYSKIQHTYTSVLSWLIRKYCRIIVPCALIIIPTSLYFWLSTTSKLDIIGLLFNVSGFGFLFGKGSLWFVSCILILYLITPLMNSIVNSRNKRNYTIILCLFSLILGYINGGNNETIYYLQFMICRFPSYFIGYMLSKNINSKDETPIWKLVLLPLSGYLILWGANRLLHTHFSLFWLQGIPVMTIFTILLKHICVPDSKSILQFFGQISLESYATNIILLPFFEGLNLSFWGMNLYLGGWIFYIIGSVICFVVSYFINKCSKIIISRIF